MLILKIVFLNIKKFNFMHKTSPIFILGNFGTRAPILATFEFQKMIFSRVVRTAPRAAAAAAGAARDLDRD